MKASKKAKELAEKLNVDLEKVDKKIKGSGKNGSILYKDLKELIDKEGNIEYRKETDIKPKEVKLNIDVFAKTDSANFKEDKGIDNITLDFILRKQIKETIEKQIQGKVINLNINGKRPIYYDTHVYGAVRNKIKKVIKDKMKAKLDGRLEQWVDKGSRKHDLQDRNLIHLFIPDISGRYAMVLGSPDLPEDRKDLKIEVLEEMIKELRKKEQKG